MTTLRFIFRVLSLSLLLASCGGGGSGGNAPVGVVVTPVPGIELLAGGLGGVGNRDASGTDARFNQPYGIAIAADGTRYVADNFNHTIRKISPTGDVTTLAGQPGVSGSADGTGAAARFNSPGGIVVAADGTIYVTDTGNFTLRAITPAGVVTTLAGLAGTAGATDGTGSAARIGLGTGMAIASDGTIYFCEADNRLLRKVTPAGVVTTVAGLAGVPGVSDGTGTDARFLQPMGLAIDGSDVLYVADAAANTIRRVTTAGVVTTWVGSAGNSGLVNGNGSVARFNTPIGVVAAADGTLYVADTQNGAIRQVSPTGDVTTLATLANIPVTGLPTPLPSGIARDGSGLLSVTDTAYHRVLTVSAAGVVTPVFGMAPLPGSTDGTGAAARFSTPRAVAAASDGKIYVADSGNYTVRVIDSGGAVTTLAGTAGSFGSANGTGSAARFNAPSGIVVDEAGTIYVADTGNHTLRKVTAAGVVTTLAGGAGLSGTADGTGTLARFSYPQGLAVDAQGNVYVADSGNHTIRKVTPAGVVTTLAGKAGSPGAVDGTGAAARFNQPAAVAVAADGTIYVSDQLNHAIRKVTATGVVTTLAGSLGTAGYADGSATVARFDAPAGIGIDGSGTLYVADGDNHLLRTVSATGDVATLAGVPGAAGVVLGALPGGLNLPEALALGFDGAVYMASENSVLKVTPPSPVSLFDVGLTASAVSVVEGQSLTLTWGSRDATNCRGAGDWSSAGALATGGSSTVTPPAAGSYTYSVTCDENGGAASKTASVTVTATPPLPTLTLTASSAYVAPGNPLTLTWSSANTTSCTASGSWTGARATSGNETLTPAAGTQTYTLDCSGAGGSISRTVTVSVSPPPVVSLTSSVTTVEVGTPFTLTWSSSNASLCMAGGGWSGTRAISGSAQVTQTITGAVSYTLNCTGGGGSTLATVTVTGQAPATGGGGSSGGGGGGGGGGALDLWGLLALGGLLLRRREARR